MERKVALLRSLHRLAFTRSVRYAVVPSNHYLDVSLARHASSQSFFTFSHPSTSPSHRSLSECKSPFTLGIGSTRSFSEDASHLPEIKDPEILNVFKDFMASNWDELPEALIHDAVNVLAKDTEDRAGKEVLQSVFRSAEAVEEFTGTLVSLKMELDDSVGLSGENVKPLSDEVVNALRTVFERYHTYLDAFGPDETYLKKKVEMEVGTKMIHLKMRCSGIGSEWGKVSVLGTSGLSGSYVEQRGP